MARYLWFGGGVAGRSGAVSTEYVVYCDESRQDYRAGNPFMAIGGLWVPRAEKQNLTKQFQRLRRDLGLRGEIKWSKVSRTRLEDYKRLVDFFFDHLELRYRVIVVEQSKVDIERYHRGDRELGFYKFYYEMLVKWIEAGKQYYILLDYKKNKGADRYTTLRRVLDRTIRGKAWIAELTVIDSMSAPLGQLCDLLTGAVAATWSRELVVGRPKTELASYIATRCGYSSLLHESASPDISKFNIYRIRLD